MSGSCPCVWLLWLSRTCPFVFYRASEPFGATCLSFLQLSLAQRKRNGSSAQFLNYLLLLRLMDIASSNTEGNHEGKLSGLCFSVCGGRMQCVQHTTWHVDVCFEGRRRLRNTIPRDVAVSGAGHVTGRCAVQEIECLTEPSVKQLRMTFHCTYLKSAWR